MKTLISQSLLICLFLILAICAHADDFHNSLECKKLVDESTAKSGEFPGIQPDGRHISIQSNYNRTEQKCYLLAIYRNDAPKAKYKLHYVLLDVVKDDVIASAEFGGTSGSNGIIFNRDNPSVTTAEALDYIKKLMNINQ